MILGLRVSRIVGLALASSAILLPAFADCDCGSLDAEAPCQGNAISVTVEGESAENRSVTFEWTFESNSESARCGTFANGDYWIAPAEGETSVTLMSVVGRDSGELSLDVNPQMESHGLLTNDYGRQNPEENIAGALPIDFQDAVSLVAVIEREEQRFGGCGTRAIVGSCVDAYNIVTVLSEVPMEAGSQTLRPSVSNVEKELLTLDDFDFSRFPRLDYIDRASADRVERIRTRWSYSLETLSLWDANASGSGASEGGRAFRADLVIDDYAATVASMWHTDVIGLMSSRTHLEDAMPALASMLTYGKDIYHGVFTAQHEQQRYFGSGAGQWHGRFPAAALFAALAKDPVYGDSMKSIAETNLELDSRGPAELEQVNPGVFGPVYGDGEPIFNTFQLGRYWGEILSNQKFDGATGLYDSNNGGRRTQRDPHGYIDGPGVGPGGWYMSVTHGPKKAFVAEMALIPELCEIVNYPLLTEYIYRLEDVGIQSSPDVCAPPDPREVPATCDTYRAKGCQYYGLSNTGMATWGPDPEDPNKCIPNNSGDRTGQNGRFPQVHGTPNDIGNKVVAVEQYFDRMRRPTLGCAASERPVPPNSIEVRKGS